MESKVMKVVYLGQDEINDLFKRTKGRLDGYIYQNLGFDERGTYLGSDDENHYYAEPECEPKFFALTQKG